MQGNDLAARLEIAAERYEKRVAGLDAKTTLLSMAEADAEALLAHREAKKDRQYAADLRAAAAAVRALDVAEIENEELRDQLAAARAQSAIDKAAIAELREQLAAANARAEKAEAQADRHERCINKLAIIANANGWDGVNNSKILEVFIGNEFDALRARVAELEAALGCLAPPVFHKSVPDSWEIYTAFASGGCLHRYTVEQAKKAQDVLARQPAQSLAAIKAETLRELRAENATLRKIAAELQIMAKRYANGRMTFACLTVNQHTKTLLDMGVKINPGTEKIIWALDGMGADFNRYLTAGQQTPGTPEAMGTATPK